MNKQHIEHVTDKSGVVGTPKFHFWGEYMISLTNISSDWMSNTSSGLCINLLLQFVKFLPVKIIVCEIPALIFGAHYVR